MTSPNSPVAVRRYFPPSLLALAISASFATACTVASAPEDDTGSLNYDTGGDTRADLGTDTLETTVIVCIDNDEDGFGENCDLGPDCNDRNPDVNPDAIELCDDGYDNNCDGTSDEDCVCRDGFSRSCFDGDEEFEGVGVCVRGRQVCDDGEWSECNNGTPRDEICNGADDDCDGEVDEGVTNPCGRCGAVPLEICGDFLDNNCNGAIDELGSCSCGDRQGQPCYSGPAHLLGFGICRGGTAVCEDGVVISCEGETLPQPEVCDGLDNDCDGQVDELLANACGECGAPEPVEVCDGVDNDCDGEIDEGLVNLCGSCGPVDEPEVCGDGLDNNCDGFIDEECACFTGDPDCWPGLPEQRNVGECSDGTRECDASGEFWTLCSGFTLPTAEICDGLDNDCDGLIDVGPSGCSVCGDSEEVCDGIDNDCDGQIDEFLRNACGQCWETLALEEDCGPTCCDGVDNDCDGLIDEGLVNVCGSCDQNCFLKTWGDPPAEWNQGDMAGTKIADDGSLILGEDFSGLPYLWVANGGENTVSRINTEIGEEEARFPTGEAPSRTAVDFDGNVFVANRAFRSQGTVTRVDARDCFGPDCVVFNAPVGPNNAVPRGVVIDEDGFPWVATYNDTTIRRLDPNTGIPIEQYNVGYRIFGTAMDAEGVIWFTSLNIPEYEGGFIGAFDPNDRTVIGSWEIPGCSNPYGIAVDPDGIVWVTNFTCNNLVRFDPRAESFNTFAQPSFDRLRGLSVDADDNVWVASYGSDQVARFDSETLSFVGTHTVCDAPIGFGMTVDRHVWTVCYGDETVIKLDYNGQVLETIPVGRDPYAFGDITGFQLRNFNSRRGRWTVTFDCGHLGCSYGDVDVTADIPGVAEIQIRGRVSNDNESWSPWAGPFVALPGNLGGLPAGQYLQLELLLRTSNRDISPEVDLVSVEWAYP